MELAEKLEFLSFLKACPTSMHTVHFLETELRGLGYEELDEAAYWELEFGKNYFVKRSGALFAFKLPLATLSKLLIHLSHTDSPGLKIKNQPKKSSFDTETIGVEIYGSPLLYTWAGRALVPAGSIQTFNGKTLSSHLVQLDDMSSFLAPLAIHLDRDVNQKGVVFNKQTELSPIFSLNRSFQEELNSRYKEEIVSFDLFLVPAHIGDLSGLDQTFLSAYRLDNLTSVYASLKALTESKTSKDTLHMALFFDHEEIGSATAEGAYSVFFEDLLKRILLVLEEDQEAYFQLKKNAFAISCDVAHGLHPNFSSKYDTENPPLLGKGVVIKHSAMKKYATSASSIGKLYLLSRGKHLFQHYYNNGEIPSGSTVGPIFSQRTGIDTIDVGIPILGMHSLHEVMAISDLNQLTQLLLNSYTYFSGIERL